MLYTICRTVTEIKYADADETNVHPYGRVDGDCWGRRKDTGKVSLNPDLSICLTEDVCEVLDVTAILLCDVARKHVITNIFFHNDVFFFASFSI